MTSTCACLPSYPYSPALSLSLSLCSIGRVSAEYLADHWEHHELKLLEWDEQQQLWDSTTPRGAAVPAPALPLLPSVKPNPAPTRKKCSVRESEDLQWAHEQSCSGLGPHQLTGSSLSSQNCLLLPKFGLEQPFSGTIKITLCDYREWISWTTYIFFSASLPLFYRMLSFGGL